MRVAGGRTVTADRVSTAEVMELRIRLERLAASAFDRACKPERRGRQGRFHSRIAFLLHGVPSDRSTDAYRLLGLGRHVYSAACDVLHGRAAAASLPAVVVEEWRGVVERLEQLHNDAVANVEDSLMREGELA